MEKHASVRINKKSRLDRSRILRLRSPQYQILKWTGTAFNQFQAFQIEDHCRFQFDGWWLDARGLQCEAELIQMIWIRGYLRLPFEPTYSNIHGLMGLWLPRLLHCRCWDSEIWLAGYKRTRACRQFSNDAVCERVRNDSHQSLPAFESLPVANDLLLWRLLLEPAWFLRSAVESRLNAS